MTNLPGQWLQCQDGAAVDVGEKTWGVAFLSATELIRSLSRNSSWELGYGERRCGFNTKHQSTKASKEAVKVVQPCTNLEDLRILATISYGWAGFLPTLGDIKTSRTSRTIPRNQVEWGHGPIMVLERARVRQNGESSFINGVKG